MPTAKQGRARTPPASRKALRQKGYGSSPEPTTVRQHIARVHPNPVQGASIQSPKVYRAKVRKTRTPGQSYKAASRTLKGVQQQERAANIRVRASKAAPEHHDSGGGFLSDVGHALSGTASSVASRTPVARALVAAAPAAKEAQKIASIKVPGTEYALKVGALAASGGDISAAMHAPKIGRSNVGEVAISAIPGGGEEAGGARLLSSGAKAVEEGVGKVVAKKEAAEAVVKDATKQGAKKVGATVAEKTPEGVKTAGKTTVRVTKTTAAKAPEPVKTVARGTAKATATTAKVAGKGARVGGKASAIGAPPVAAGLSAKKKGNISGAAAPFTGTAEAIWNDPIGTAKTTAKGLPSLVTAPLGIAENAALSGGRLASTAAHALHAPLAHGYSGKEIAAPLKSSGDELKDYGTELKDVYTSGDPKTVEKYTAGHYKSPRAIEEYANQIEDIVNARAKAHPDRWKSITHAQAVAYARGKVPETGGGLLPAASVAFPAAKLIRSGNKLAGAKIGVIEDEIGAGATRKLGRRVGPVDRLRVRNRERRGEAQAAVRKKLLAKRMEKDAADPIEKNANKAGGPKKYTRERNLQEGAIPLAVQEGIPLGPHGKKVLEKIVNHEDYKDRPADVSEHGVIPHDVARYALENWDRLHKDPHFREAVQAARTQARYTDTHVGVKYKDQAITHGRKLPEEYHVKEAQNLHLATRANEPVFQGFKNGEIATKLSRESGRKVTAAEVKKWRGESAQARTMRGQKLRAKQDATFERNMKAFAKKEGLEEPHYVADVNIKKGSIADVVADRSPTSQTSFATKRNKGEVRAAGIQDLSLRSYLEHSVKRPRRIRVIHGDSKRLFREGNLPVIVPGRDGELRSRRGVNHAEYTYGLTHDAQGNKVPEGRKAQINSDDHMLVDTGRLNHAVRDVRAEPETYEANLKDAIDQSVLKADLAEKGKGKRYVVMPRAKVEEWIAQNTPHRAHGLERAARWPFQAILAYRPKWLLSQPLAEGATSAMSTSPVAQIAGTRGMKGKGLLPFTKLDAGKISRDAENEIAARAGSTAGIGYRSDQAAPFGRIHDVNVGGAAPDLDPVIKSKVGQGLIAAGKGDASRALDLWKGGKIREANLKGKMWSELRGPVKRIGRALGVIEELDKKYKGKSFKEQSELMAKDKKTMARLEQEVIRGNGDWSSMLRSGAIKENALGSIFTFYPYLRFATTWYLRYAKAHPVKAAALTLLASQNEQKLMQIYGGSPSFLTGWANAPLYGGLGKDLGRPTSLLPFAFGSPGSNPLIQAVGGEAGGSGALSLLNPWAGLLYHAFSGRDPLSGRVQAEDTGPRSVGKIAGTAAADLGSWIGVLSEADQIAGRGASRFLKGNPANSSLASQRFDKISQPNSFLGRLDKAVDPLHPLNTNRERQAAEIGRLLDRQFAQPASDQEVIDAFGSKRALKTKAGQHKAIEYLRTALEGDYAQQRLKRLDEDQLGIAHSDLNKRQSAMLRIKNRGGGYGLNREQLLDLADQWGVKYPNVPPFRARRVRRTPTPRP